MIKPIDRVWLKMTERNSISHRWKSLSNLERCIVIVFIAGFLIFLISIRHGNRQHQETILRDQFHLPSSLKFASFEPAIKKNSGPLQGTVRFSESEYKNYTASLSDPNIWKPMPLPDRRIGAIGRYSAGALRWSETKPPIHFDDVGMARFGIYEDSNLNQLENALHFCYAVVRSNLPTTTVSAYAAVSCWELDPREVPSVMVQGVLDPETRTLYMRI